MGTYDTETQQLTGWFRNRLALVDPFMMTEENYQAGTDKLPGDLKVLIKAASDHWSDHRKYQLSYQQMHKAFFGAAFATNKLTLVPRHPQFRLGTQVLIKKVKIPRGPA